MTEAPELAISIRQPWAWAILHAGKDVENRTWLTDYRGWVFVHASTTMTQDEYRTAAEAIEKIIGKPPPPACDLTRGGLIGMVRIIDSVKISRSPWFNGHRALVLKDARPTPFIACQGELGIFRWKVSVDGAPAPVARWMTAEKKVLPTQGSLL